MEQNFIQQICDNPNQDDIRNIYADWLIERGDMRGEFLRLELEQNSTKNAAERANLRTKMNKLRREIDPTWVLNVERIVVENCGQPTTPETKKVTQRSSQTGSPIAAKATVELLNPCDKNWLELEETGNSTVRHCSKCNSKVFHVSTIDEAQRHTQQGRCVAVCNSLSRAPNDLTRVQLLRGIMLPGLD